MSSFDRLLEEIDEFGEWPDASASDAGEPATGEEREEHERLLTVVLSGCCAPWTAG
jgi:hypothetical protein